MSVGKLRGPPKSKVSTLEGPEMSVMKTLNSTLERLVCAVSDMKQKESIVSCTKLSESLTNHDPSFSVSIDERIPVEDLIVLNGFLNENHVQVLKGDGCNTNVVSHEFFSRNKEQFSWKKCDMRVSHSKKGSVENSSEVILGAIHLSESIPTSLIGL